MNKLLMPIGMMFMLATGTANAASKAAEMDVASRCAVSVKLNKENSIAREFTNYVEVVDRAQREIIIDIITSYEFSIVEGQIYPNVSVEKIGIMKTPNGHLMIVFADKNDCVWSYYVFDEEDQKKFFDEITRRGA